MVESPELSTTYLRVAGLANSTNTPITVAVAFKTMQGDN